MKFKDDVNFVLKEEKFDNLKSLLIIEGKKILPVDQDNIDKALSGVDLTEDEDTYVKMLFNTINSEKEFKIEYIYYTKNASEAGKNAYVEYMDGIDEELKSGTNTLTPEGNLTSMLIYAIAGNGLTIPTRNGVHILIVETPVFPQNERSTTIAHEVFGHGIPAARGEGGEGNNSNAIRADNLVRRILNMPQRDGSDHSGGLVKNPSSLPYIK